MWARVRGGAVRCGGGDGRKRNVWHRRAVVVVMLQMDGCRGPRLREGERQAGDDSTRSKVGWRLQTSANQAPSPHHSYAPEVVMRCTLYLLLLQDICIPSARRRIYAASSVSAVETPVRSLCSWLPIARPQRHRATSGWHASWPPSLGTPKGALTTRFCRPRA